MHRVSSPRDYHLTTAEILYHLPDHPGLLQSFIWQDFDIAPRYPVLHKFLGFWTRELDGKLHSVRVAPAPLAGRQRVRHASTVLSLPSTTRNFH
ncbi:MAG: hypothetical protein ACKVOX_01025 [Rhizobacter sp.]